MKRKYDFGGYATRNDLRCSDGRTIRKDAFKDCDGMTVPLVWNHCHNELDNVLGHAVLENREDGVYCYCSLNNSDIGRDAKERVIHGDITNLSIYANQLKQNGKDVIHGIIREVSLVLAGANPGAWIDDIAMAHGEDADGEAVIFNDDSLVLAHGSKEDDEDEEENKKTPEEEEKNEADNADENSEDDSDDDSDDDSKENKIEHSDNKEDDKMADKTVQEVFDTMNEDQKKVCYAMVGAALEEAGVNNDDGGDENMKHNAFENDDNNEYLMHAEFEQAVMGDAKRCGSVKEAFLEHSAEYGIDHIDWLQPEFKNINGDGAPGFIKRQPDAWVDVVLNGVHHTPFSKVKMMFADLREDEARAKGYLKGKLKKEEVFGLLKRQVSATTIYKKQKFDRDDVIEITSFDMIAWVKGEMRMMLDEELARAILFGDGRSSLSEDKINEDNIIPVVADEDFYAMKKVITPATGETLGHAIINGTVKAQDDYEGSGNLTAFFPNSTVTDMLLLEDNEGHRMYKDMRELALAMSVEKIVKVPASIVPEGIYGVVLDLKDYNIGADKGGAVNMFEDFDIDYNQQKYLIETRCSGALTKPFSAIVLKTNE